VIRPTSHGFLLSPYAAATGAAVFTLLLGTACVYDVRTRKIPNWLVVALAISGLTYSVLAAPGPRGLIPSVLGLLVGLAIWLPSWLFRLLGAGDVKLFAAACTWLGARGALEGAILAAFAGGVLALIWMLRYRGLRGSALTVWAASVHPKSLIQPVTGVSSAPALPYTVPLAIGAMVVAWFPRILF
jgi:prepilin peptidase CpaA